MKDTSIEAYRELILSGKAHNQRGRIFLFLCGAGKGMTRQELSRSTGVPINAVCGRVNELLKHGVVQEKEKVKCGVTGKNVYSVSACVDNEKPEQQKLF